METLFPDNSSSYYRSSTYREKIKNASFVNYIDTTDVVVSWDVSEAGDGSIMAWLSDNETEGYYDLYFGSESTIYVKNLGYLFSGLTYIDSISFDNLDTSLTTRMVSMFENTGYNSTVFALDLGENFNTLNVTDMSYMFDETGYKSTVFTLDLGEKFDTSNVTNMSKMFYWTGYANSNLELDLSMFDFSAVTSYSSMFGGFSSTKKIYVKDETDQTWILEKGFSGLSESNVLIKS